ncbi:dipeptide ABC transporter ATP-binding protein [Natronobiforma cellulositropha]|uniref:dipeptide ABC transporter ATP-binding protein n=1 Tax=Natronobiforma cellulositropha TaxID=1679076 RepID=UPI0021D598BE|nr:ABC transporter ATP-binding protein [Natronobiforma cellulositropha]
MDPLLSVENLHTRFRSPDGPIHAVDGASFTVHEGEIVGLVGESASGKSVTARSIVGLESPGEVVEGSITFDGTDLTTASEATHRRLRASEISTVFQDPHGALNPSFTVGEQLSEAVALADAPERVSLPEFLGVPPFRRRRAWGEYREQAAHLLETVGISDAADRLESYPHQLSGGQRQRVVLAMALASNPRLLLADEPTTALDTTTQAQLLEQIRGLRDEFGTAVVLITHDLGVVAETCDRVVVLYGGRVMETGPTQEVLADPAHPYTRGLLECLLGGLSRKARPPTIGGVVPTRIDPDPGCPFASRCAHATEECRTVDPPTVGLDAERRVACSELEAVQGAPLRPDSSSLEHTGGTAGGSDGQVSHGHDGDGSGGGDRALAFSADPLVELEGVSKTFEMRGSILEQLRGTDRSIRALEDVSLSVWPGETVGIVGESGSGKSTLARVLTGLCEPTAGTVRLGGDPVGTVGERTADQVTEVGVVFQHPRASINPRQTVAQALAEPMCERGWDPDRRDRRVDELLDLVDLSSEHRSRYPHQLSGGQLQRVAIARALALEPRLLVLDEPVSALDASIRAKVLSLLLDLQERLGLAYVLVSHDLEVVSHVADRLLVVYAGQVMERGPVETVVDRPSHPYTQALFEAIPALDGDGRARGLAGEPPSLADPPGGCAFHPRCPHATEECVRTEPPAVRVGDARSRCHVAEEVAAAARDDADGDETVGPASTTPP